MSSFGAGRRPRGVGFPHGTDNPVLLRFFTLVLDQLADVSGPDQGSGSIWNQRGIELTTAPMHGLCNRIEKGKHRVGRQMVLSCTWQVILEVAYVLFNRSDVLLK